MIAIVTDVHYRMSLALIRDLGQAGVEVLTCGTCLNCYGLTDQLAVGEVTNMYTITEKRTGAHLVVRP